MDFQDLALNAGIHFNTGYQPAALTESVRRALANDSALITAPNSGVLSVLTTYVDPRVIDVVVAPMRMAETFGETKKGTWVDDFLTFPIAESTGEVSSYGDFNNNGMTGTNLNWETRQPYHYQAIMEIGDRELERAGAGRVDLVSRKQISNALALNKFQNKSYLYGIDGLMNYGLLNDPTLLADLPLTDWTLKDGLGIYDDILNLYTQLIEQTSGLVDAGTRVKLLLSPSDEARLHSTNMYNMNTYDHLLKNFKNWTIHSIPEYETAAGGKIQLVVDEYEGVPTVDLSFTEKMRAHRVEYLTSAWRQKRSQGTNGAIIYRPLFISNGLIAR